MKIYISSPVSFYQRDWNNSVSSILRGSGHVVYLPQEIIQPSKSHKSFEFFVYEKCVEWIDDSDLGLLLLPYGRDCAWEVGYYRGLNKPLAVYVDKLNPANLERLRDWMIKGSVDVIICAESVLKDELQKDPIISKKSVLVAPLNELPKILDHFLDLQTEPTHFLGAGAVVIRQNKVLLVEEQTSSAHYNKRKGMWGFPTKTVINTSPETQALFALKDEAGLTGYQPKFLSIQNIPRATGLFYKVESSLNTPIKNGQWFNITDVLKGKIPLRPTFDRVLEDALSA